MAAGKEVLTKERIDAIAVTVQEEAWRVVARCRVWINQSNRFALEVVHLLVRAVGPNINNRVIAVYASVVTLVDERSGFNAGHDCTSI